MTEAVLVKPRAIRAFEKRFKTEADRWGDVFYLRIASSWSDFFRSVFCFVNDAGFQEKNIVSVENELISSGGVTFSGRLSRLCVWGSDCLLVKGQIVTPSPDRLIMAVSDGIYLLASVDSDTDLSWL